MKIVRAPKIEHQKLVVMVYGLTDAGKTYFVGTAQQCEETSPMLLIDTDGGTATLAGTGIHIASPRNFQELQELYDFLREENTEYRSVGIDSVTAQQRDISMPSVLGDIDDEAAMRDLGSSKPPTQRDWLSSQYHMRKFLTAFRDLARLKDPKRRLHVFMTAGERMDERRDIGVPALPGVLGLEVGGYVDILGRLVLDIPEDETAKEVRRLYTTKHHDEQDGAIYIAKNRRRMLPRVMKNPSVDKVMKYWLERK